MMSGRRINTLVINSVAYLQFLIGGGGGGTPRRGGGGGGGGGGGTAP